MALDDVVPSQGEAAPHTLSRFMALFTGYESAYGLFRVGEATDTEATGTSTMQYGAPTDEEYLRHLRGEVGLGIIALRDDDSVRFGAIETDPMDAEELAQRIFDLKLPLVVCRSRTGLHLYCFTTEPIPASTMRTRLSEFAGLLGLDSPRLHPRQSYRVGKDDTGTWIDLPYWGGLAGNMSRAVVGLEGELPVSDGVWLMEAAAIVPERMRATWRPSPSLFADGPPCLQHYERLGRFPGTERLAGMEVVLTYLRKRFGAKWPEHLAEYNLAGFAPNELVSLQHNASRKGISGQYPCTTELLSPHCDQQTCLQRRFGLGKQNGAGTTATEIEYDGITKYVPPPEFDEEALWGISLNGHRILVTTDVLNSNRKFREYCLDRIHVLVGVMPAAQWNQLVESLAQRADIVPVHESKTVTGGILALIREYLTSEGRAERRDQVVQGKPFFEGDRVYFLPHKMIQRLAEQMPSARSALEPRRIWRLLEARGAEAHPEWEVGPELVAVWSLPESRIGRLPERVVAPVMTEEF